MTSQSVHLGDCISASVPVASLCQVCFLFLSLHLQLPVSSLFLGLLGVCLRLRVKGNVWGFSGGLGDLLCYEPTVASIAALSPL